MSLLDVIYTGWSKQLGENKWNTLTFSCRVIYWYNQNFDMYSWNLYLHDTLETGLFTKCIQRLENINFDKKLNIFINSIESKPFRSQIQYEIAE